MIPPASGEPRGSMSEAESIIGGNPAMLANSPPLEFELLGEPMTRMTSTNFESS